MKDLYGEKIQVGSIVVAMHMKDIGSTKVDMGLAKVVKLTAKQASVIAINKRVMNSTMSGSIYISNDGFKNHSKRIDYEVEPYYVKKAFLNEIHPIAIPGMDKWIAVVRSALTTNCVIELHPVEGFEPTSGKFSHSLETLTNEDVATLLFNKLLKVCSVRSELSIEED